MEVPTGTDRALWAKTLPFGAGKFCLEKSGKPVSGSGAGRARLFWRAVLSRTDQRGNFFFKYFARTKNSLLYPLCDRVLDLLVCSTWVNSM